MIQYPTWFAAAVVAIVGVILVILVGTLISAIASNISLGRRAAAAEAKLAEIGEGIEALLRPPAPAPEWGPEDDAELLALWEAVKRP